MKILITGATGFVGRALCLQLFREGHELLLVSRKQTLPADWGLPRELVYWDPTQGNCPRNLDDIDALVHLMGESIAVKRWNRSRRQLLRDSRGLATQRVVEALKSRRKPLECIISASAIGYYPYDGAANLIEASPPGQHFLAQVCQEWEAPLVAAPAKRTIVLRCGMVLGADGGVMQKLRPLFACGLGGRLGNGNQVISWIHRSDLVQLIATALKDQNWNGVYNCVSPFPVTNSVFTKTLARTLRMPAFLPVPAGVLKLVFGAMSDLLLKSQQVNPLRLINENFNFRYPKIDQALAEVCAVHPKGGKNFACHTLESQQFIAKPLAEVFEFFCNPYNLEQLTPSSMHFKILSISTPKVQEGTIIRYRLKLHGIPLHWTSQILNWQPGKQFVDTQDKGPYSIWHHTHSFEAVAGGTLMTDRVKYRVPFGSLGELLVLPFIKANLRTIFAYRRAVISRLYG